MTATLAASVLIPRQEGWTGGRDGKEKRGREGVRNGIGRVEGEVVCVVEVEGG